MQGQTPSHADWSINRGYLVNSDDVKLNIDSSTGWLDATLEFVQHHIFRQSGKSKNKYVSVFKNIGTSLNGSWDSVCHSHFCLLHRILLLLLPEVMYMYIILFIR